MEPTGPSAGKLPRYESMISPLGIFRRNKAHSNKVGLMVDKGVKVTASNEEDPREFLAITHDIR